MNKMIMIITLLKKLDQQNEYDNYFIKKNRILYIINVE